MSTGTYCLESTSFVVQDFFKTYGDVMLPDGTPAKLAIFFPQTEDVTELRPIVETALTKIGLSPALLLEHHTKNENKADFDRFKSKDSPHRVALLVSIGVEGWNVPALFACALQQFDGEFDRRYRIAAAQRHCLW